MLRLLPGPPQRTVLSGSLKHQQSPPRVLRSKGGQTVIKTLVLSVFFRVSGKRSKIQSWPRTSQIDRNLSVSSQRVHIASRLAENHCFFTCFEGSMEKGQEYNRGRELARSTGNCRFHPTGSILQAVGLQTYVLSVFSVVGGKMSKIQSWSRTT